MAVVTAGIRPVGLQPSAAAEIPACRSCGTASLELVVDLGPQPLANSYLTEAELARNEPRYPLKLYRCPRCHLVQIPAAVPAERIFSEYAYFSSISEQWLRHAQNYCKRMITRFELGKDSLAVEIGSNDGYLLQYLLADGIPSLGIEPARNVAKHAAEKGVPTIAEFFGQTLALRLAREGKRADLLIANNVLAHVPHLHDFVAGIKILLSQEGVATIEFPHLVRLLEGNQFDTIYHEHFSYFSLLAVQGVLRRHGLEIFDVEEISVHGGSLRLFVTHAERRLSAAPPVERLLHAEGAGGYDTAKPYSRFSEKCIVVRNALMQFLAEKREQGKRVAGYGAPAKGNTLLNYCNVSRNDLAFTVDRSPYKQGKYLPGTHIPIYPPEAIDDARPDYILILPWNLKDEIVPQLQQARAWGARFVVAIPELSVF